MDGLAWSKVLHGSLITGNDQNTQNSKMLFDLLSSSLSIEGMQCIQLWSEQYEINGLVSGELFP